MASDPQLPTTSQKLADQLFELIRGQGGFRSVEVMHPTDGLQSLGANSALVIHTRDGSRFGLEVCPFPTLRAGAQPPGKVRGVEPEWSAFNDKGNP